MSKFKSAMVFGSMNAAAEIAKILKIENISCFPWNDDLKMYHISKCLCISEETALKYARFTHCGSGYYALIPEILNENVVMYNKRETLEILNATFDEVDSKLVEDLSRILEEFVGVKIDGQPMYNCAEIITNLCEDLARESRIDKKVDNWMFGIGMTDIIASGAVIEGIKMQIIRSKPEDPDVTTLKLFVWDGSEKARLEIEENFQNRGYALKVIVNEENELRIVFNSPDIKASSKLKLGQYLVETKDGGCFWNYYSKEDNAKDWDHLDFPAPW